MSSFSLCIVRRFLIINIFIVLGLTTHFNANQKSEGIKLQVIWVTHVVNNRARACVAIIILIKYVDFCFSVFPLPFYTCMWGAVSVRVELGGCTCDASENEIYVSCSAEENYSLLDSSQRPDLIMASHS